MTFPPMPLVFHPRLVAKPWGGRRLETLFGKPLPRGAIGESWELARLPQADSLVRAGPLAGLSLGEVLRDWGTDLLGSAPRSAGRFPLLVKFLDAREPLSIQVHPRPAADDPAGHAPDVKHEAWYIVDAPPGAQLLAGLKPGVGPREIERTIGTAQLADLLETWPAEPGRCYHLPAGTLHALGAGVLVAEVQTPSDVTYRAYDWDRRDADGRSRALHVPECLANIRYDVKREMIAPAPRPGRHGLGELTRVCACERFALDHVRVTAAGTHALTPGPMRVWILLRGAGELVRTRGEHAYGCACRAGDVVLIPADCGTTSVCFGGGAELLEVTVPAGS